MRRAWRCCWSSRMWCRASTWRTGPISWRMAPSCCREARPISATTPLSSALISDCETSMEKPFDLVIKNARVVRPNATSVHRLDIAINDGRIARLAPDLAAEQGQVFDAKNLLAFPGCVDAHMHIGIYAPLAQDAVSESKAAAIGGVTSSLNYIRTGHYY